MTILHKKMDKADMRDMPAEAFPGRIYVISSPNEESKALRYLSEQKLVGVDTETRPSFKKGRINKVALLQVATEDVCFLFRLNRLGLTQGIIDFFENAEMTKVGLSLGDDMRMLHARAPFNAAGFIDLQKHIGEIGIEDLSLSKIYANLFGKRISKRQQLTNWEADALTERQQLYAATDAWACLQIYKELLRLEKTHDYRLMNNE